MKAAMKATRCEESNAGEKKGIRRGEKRRQDEEKKISRENWKKRCSKEEVKGNEE